MLPTDWSSEIEGKLDSLADRIFERYVNRFFDDECASFLALFTRRPPLTG